MLGWLNSYHYLASSATILALIGYSAYLLLRAGIFAVPQIAYFCVGAYVATILTVDLNVPFFVAVISGGFAAAGVGTILGVLLRNVDGIYLAVATIGSGEVARVVARNLEITGGPSGIIGIPRVTQDWHLVVTLTVVVLACAFLALQRYGVAMDAVRQDQLVAQHLGVALHIMRIQLFTVSGLIAGIAGGLFAHFRGFIIPNDFTLTVLLGVLALVVVGGMYGATGPLIGAVVIHSVPELFDGLEEYRTLLLGAMLALIILFTPRGVGGLLGQLAALVKRRLKPIERPTTVVQRGAFDGTGEAPAVSAAPRRSPKTPRVADGADGAEQVRPAAPVTVSAEPARVGSAGTAGVGSAEMAGVGPTGSAGAQLAGMVSSGEEPRAAVYAPALSVKGVTMRFGGLRALSDVSFDVRADEFIGLIGPNGSGKSTLINVISGALRPTAGRISVCGRELPLGRPERIAASSVARSFQGIRLFADYPALANVALGAYQRRRRPSGRLKGYLAFRADEAEAMLHLVGVPSSLWSREVGTLPYGVQRRVEIARALMAGPRLLMLDEPTAGMSEDETYEVFQLVADVARERSITVLAVEHDVPVIRSFCDRVVVLNFGQLIADGCPDDVLSEQTVVEAYLGQS